MHILPRRSRFQVTDSNKGDRRTSKIIDSTGTLAARTLSSGMMSGVTSPARPWFRLTTPDPDLSEFGPVKEWLHIVESRMRTSFLRSNLYNTLPTVYKDQGVFGTAPMLVEEDFDSVFRTSSFPIGSYMIATNYKGVVNTFIREFRMTVRQVVEQFAKRDDNSGKIKWDNISDYVKNSWESNQTENWVEICHAILPNENYEPAKQSKKFKKFASIYYEKGSANTTRSSYITKVDEDKLLRESGYDFFPVLCPRWEVTGEDVYGTECPGMIALPDIKQLQLGERRLMQAIEKIINPPMLASTALRMQSPSILPGDITFIDPRQDAGAAFRPAFEIDFRIQELEQKQAQVRDRVRRAFFEDLFLMMAQTERSQITAREIDERHEEKLLALGPVLEQLNQDLLDPLIDLTFDIHLRQGLIPPPPEELPRGGSQS